MGTRDGWYLPVRGAAGAPAIRSRLVAVEHPCAASKGAVDGLDSLSAHRAAAPVVQQIETAHTLHASHKFQISLRQLAQE